MTETVVVTKKRKDTRLDRVERALTDCPSECSYREMAQLAIDAYPDPLIKHEKDEKRVPLPNDYHQLHALRSELQELCDALDTVDAEKFPRAVAIAKVLREQGEFA